MTRPSTKKTYLLPIFYSKIWKWTPGQTICPHKRKLTNNPLSQKISELTPWSDHPQKTTYQRYFIPISWELTPGPILFPLRKLLATFYSKKHENSPLALHCQIPLNKTTYERYIIPKLIGADPWPSMAWSLSPSKKLINGESWERIPGPPSMASPKKTNISTIFYSKNMGSDPWSSFHAPPPKKNELLTILYSKNHGSWLPVFSLWAPSLCPKNNLLTIFYSKDHGIWPLTCPLWLYHPPPPQKRKHNSDIIFQKSWELIPGPSSMSQHLPSQKEQN